MTTEMSEHGAPDLSEIRERIDAIDTDLLRLFNERLDVSVDVARAKRAMGKAIYDPARERAKLLRLTEGQLAERQPQVIALFSLLMSMSKTEQQRFLHAGDPVAPSRAALAALKPELEPFPTTATVACQGVEGAYSQIAACRLFSVPGISFFSSFDGVFRAVRDGFCDYGVLPIENSTAGSVNAVYDLLAKFGFCIVRSLRLKVSHNLMARPGTRIEDVREVYSHEQALEQCAGYLERIGAKPRVCENTAMAAQLVAESDRDDVAALASASSAELYGLDILERGIQDSDSNYTRFVVVSAKPQVYAGADRTSLMLSLPHEPGSLYRVLERFYSLDINLAKLESRPIPGRDFEFSFYFDLECPVGSPAFSSLMDSLGDVCSRLTYFGSYQEMI